MLVKIGSYNICDGTLAGGVAVGQGRYQVGRSIEVVQELGALKPVLFDRVGRRITFTFTVERTFADAKSAEQFVSDLDGASGVPSTGNVTLTLSDGTTVRYIPNGKVTGHQSDLLGAKTRTTYTIVGSHIDTAP